MQIAQVDISPRWRSIDDLTVWKRVVGGGIQLLGDYLRFLGKVRGAEVVHLTTSGRLATVRDLAICLTARLFAVPVVYHLHFGRVPEIAAAGTREWRFLCRSLRLADVVLALDTPTACTIKAHLPASRVEVLPNPIDIGELPAGETTKQTAKTVLFLGWLLPTKGVEELLQAWRGCSEEPWELMVAGPCSTEYLEMLKTTYRVPRVRFLGELSHEQAMDLLATCTVFVLPSHTEAFPYVVLEAMSLGRCIVATNVGAIPEMLAEGCGSVVPAKDIAALAEALRTVMHDETLRSDFGRRAAAKAASCYSLGTVMSLVTDLWVELASMSHKRA